MSIYTELIEQTKKELKEGSDGISNLDVLEERLETLQLAEKIHEEFVERINELDNKRWDEIKQELKRTRRQGNE